ncbi:MAG: response regulator [Actinobacteria bacterium]|nr:response regulator [Actinomycetota bacterium]
MSQASPSRSASAPGPAGVPRPVRVMVVDDNAGFRESLLALLDTEELLVVGEARSGAEALAMVLQVDPDVVLMDVRMPAMDGIEATRQLKRIRPSIGVVALSGHEDQEIVRGMLVAGASGYVLKDSDGDDILNAVMRAALGGAVLSPEVTPTVIEELTEALERERRRTKELEVALAALVERSTRRHELVARLGHELRTPITVILGMAQTLAEGTAPVEHQRELLEVLMSRATGLARLVERFEIALEAGFTEWVDVPAAAREVVAGNPRVTVVADDPLPPASLNSLVARRILEELIDNALRFSPEGSPVEVRVGMGPSGLETRVVDRGAGIDPADRERIFEPLEQLEDLNVRTHQGAGLGLSVARTAARAMEGDVELESSGPQGSTFVWRVALER